MNSVHGLIYAYHAYPDLRELGTHRTGAALPFCGRYRLIDFSLSGMMHAGVRNVGVIMQRGYLSLMEHLSSGRTWNLARTAGGLHLLPPYGLPDAGLGTYAGCMEALGADAAMLEETALCLKTLRSPGYEEEWEQVKKNRLQLTGMSLTDILKLTLTMFMW